nr:MAG TPA: hypothetical protein [Caudoviricetes sp.]
MAAGTVWVQIAPAPAYSTPSQRRTRYRHMKAHRGTRCHCVPHE